MRRIPVSYINIPLSKFFVYLSGIALVTLGHDKIRLAVGYAEAELSKLIGQPGPFRYYLFNIAPEILLVLYCRRRSR